MDDYLTVRELSAALNVSRATIYRLIDQGLPSVRIGHARRFSWSAVEAWVQGLEEATDAARAPSLPSPEILQPGDYQCVSCGWIGHVPTPCQRVGYCPQCRTQAPQVRRVNVAR